MLLSVSGHAQLNIFKQDSVTIGKSTYPAQLSFGGAIRLNYSWKTYDDDLKKREGGFGFELFLFQPGVQVTESVFII